MGHDGKDDLVYGASCLVYTNYSTTQLYYKYCGVIMFLLYHDLFFIFNSIIVLFVSWGGAS